MPCLREKSENDQLNHSCNKKRNTKRTRKLTDVEYEAARNDPEQTRVPRVGKYIAHFGKFSKRDMMNDPMQYIIPVQKVPVCNDIYKKKKCEWDEKRKA